PQEAVEKLMQAYRLSPESAEIQTQLVTIYGARRDWPNAGDVANSWAQLEPENPKAQLVLGWCSLMNHESLDATVILKPVCQKAPQDIEAHNIYGIALLEQRKFDDAQKQFEAALALDAQYLPARLNLIALYGFKGQNAYALELIEKLQLQEPENSCVLSLHAWLEMKLGNFDEANNLNCLAMSHDLQEPLALICGGIIFRKQGKLDESAALLQKAIKLFPDSPLPLYELSATCVAQGKNTQAIETAQLALQIAPSNLDAKAALALALIAAKNYEGAIPLLKECVLRNPKDLQLRMVLSRAQVSRGDKEIAQTTLEKARTAFPDRAEPLIGLADLAFDFRNYRQSEQLLQEALVCNPDNHEALLSLARTNFAMGKFDSCLDQFDTLQSADLQPKDVLLKARCEYALRQFSQSCADYEKVMHSKSILDSADFVNYAQALLQSGQYVRAQELISSIESNPTIMKNASSHELGRIQAEIRNCMRRTH
ncbi:MAG: tetratricopeptide repeat protein, partial [Candidatus Obscuribacterales bacterium]|nr:tetratricopeptide repeat protein [Candidatus Obscuribacterales bacterium]